MPKRILIAEDTKVTMLILSHLLANEGYEVIEAYDGDEALAYCAKQNIDLAIIDLGLPKRNGLEIARTIKGEVPFMVMTADKKDRSVQKALESGAINYIVKPVTQEIFLTSIKAALSVAQDKKNLENALDQSRNISLAIGLVSGRLNMHLDDAKESIFKTATDRRMKVSELAEEIIYLSEQQAESAATMTTFIRTAKG